jgi:hypothetical protein
MHRQRPMPEPGPVARFLRSRGIPSYIEGRGWFVLGVDLLAAQYAAYSAYGRIEQLRGNAAAAREYTRKALAVKKLVNGAWWDEAAQRFHSMLGADYKFQGPDDYGLADRAVLYYGAAEDGSKAKSALDRLVERTRRQPGLNVEEESHYAEIFYRYGMPDMAYAQLLDLTRPDKQRREYPEVSYSVIGAIVGGTMGVSVDVDGTVRTEPALVAQTEWAEVGNLPLRANVVSVRHEANRSTTLANQSGPAVTWHAAFRGSLGRLLVDGKAVRAQTGTAHNGTPFSWVNVTVKPGGRAHVEIPK